MPEQTDKLWVEITHIPTTTVWRSYMTHDELSNLVDCVSTSILINNGVDNHLNELRKVYIPYKILSECSVEFQPIAD